MGFVGYASIARHLGTETMSAAHIAKNHKTERNGKKYNGQAWQHFSFQYL